MGASLENLKTIADYESFIDRVREQRRQLAESPDDIRCDCKLCTEMWYK